MLNNIALIIFACLLTGCATSPTGRSQFLYMPKDQVDQMGLQAFEDLKTKKPISKNSQYNGFVSCIADILTKESDGKWELVVFEDDTLNAFALPGNKIGVHTGLVKMVDNQDQLAAVIGHEIGHVIAQHSNERMSQEAAVNQSVSLISAVSAPTSPIGQLAVSSLGIGAQYGIILPFSRTHESEADIIGLDLMAKAGFDPRESITLWQKMAQASQGGQQPAEFMSTHPSHDTRIQELTEHMPKAMEAYQQAQAMGKKPNCTK